MCWSSGPRGGSFGAQEMSASGRFAYRGVKEFGPYEEEDSNLPRLKPERLECGFFRSAEALLPPINAGAPTERRSGCHGEARRVSTSEL
jgi:hypothetical protein